MGRRASAELTEGTEDAGASLMIVETLGADVAKSGGEMDGSLVPLLLGSSISSFDGRGDVAKCAKTSCRIAR